MRKKMKAAIYARVSDKDQHCEMQLTELNGVAQRFGWEPIEYVEKASGKTGGKRPVLDRLLADGRLRKFDVVLVWKLDRFGRSVLDFVRNIQALDALGIRFFCPGQGIDTDQKSPISRLLMHILVAVAEFERELIRERTRAGQAQYTRDFAAGKVGKERHSKSGRDLPSGRPKKIFPRDKALALRKKGKSIREIAQVLGVGRGTIERLLKTP